MDRKTRHLENREEAWNRISPEMIERIEKRFGVKLSTNKALSLKERWKIEAEAYKNK